MGQGARTSRWGNRLVRSIRPARCRGCGRSLPAGSETAPWSVWDGGFRHRAKLCPECEAVVYGCHERRRLSWDDDLWLVREMCSTCDAYPLCERSEYLRRTQPGDWCFSALGEGV